MPKPADVVAARELIEEFARLNPQDPRERAVELSRLRLSAITLSRKRLDREETMTTPPTPSYRFRPHETLAARPSSAGSTTRAARSAITS